MRMSVNGKRICYACDRETMTTVTVALYTVHCQTSPSVIAYVEHWLCSACFIEEQRYDTRGQDCHCVGCTGSQDHCVKDDQF